MTTTEVHVTVDTDALAQHLIKTITGKLTAEVCELIRNVEDRTDERDQALTAAHQADAAAQRLTRVVDLREITIKCRNTEINGLKLTLADMARQRDAAIDDVERLQAEASGAASIIAGFMASTTEHLDQIATLTAERDQAWATITRMTLDADAPTKQAPKLKRGGDAPSSVDPGGYVYLWRQSDAVDGTVHPSAYVRVAWNDLPVPGITGDTNDSQ